MILWHPDLLPDHPMEITVTFLLDYATVTTSFEGKNNWDEAYCLLHANKMLNDEYSFSPYYSMHDHEIEVEIMPAWTIKEIA